MTDRSDLELSLARQQRAAGFAIAGAVVVWMGLQFLGAQGYITTRVLFLFDFAALAVMVWALVVTYRVWRRKRANDSR
ncbi:DUF5337 domain-containing protein [Oceaniglobus ichthyenteri]|uniref:DUF5337 domain-containing protein n=1 Tax=Oceaniglobus ichthyenteri TaxID=2136177 RepID=UPI000D37E786|nr:DUF5337 domain-containing protein [Oceaniglobus ichthyenteri]